MRWLTTGAGHSRSAFSLRRGMSLLYCTLENNAVRWSRPVGDRIALDRVNRRLRMNRDGPRCSPPEDARLPDSWTGLSDRWDYAWVRSTSRESVVSRSGTLRIATLLEMDPRRHRRHRDADRLPRSRVLFLSLSLSFALSSRETADHDGVGNFCASPGKIETWTAQQADCTSLTVRYFRPCDVIERREPEIER